LLTPLIVTTEPHFLSPMGKAIVFRVGVEVLLVFYIALILLDRKFVPPQSPLLWAVVAYLALLLVATVVSLDPYRSWWGTFERMDGAFAMLHYGVFFAMLAGLFRAQRDWVLFFYVSLCVSVVVGVYAVVERIALGYSGVISTLDSSPFLGAYALFHVFLAGMSIHWARTRLSRGSAAVALGLNLVTLFLTGERGPLVGLAAGLLVLAVVVLIRRMGSPYLRLAAKTVILLLIAAPFLLHYARGSAILRSSRTLNRLSAISLNDPGTIVRLICLEVSRDAFEAKPVFGYGPELFFVASDRNFNPKQLSYEQSWMDRSHNKLADVLVMQGLTGLLAYLGVFVAAGWLLYGVLKRNKANIAEVLLTIGLLVAYFVQNLFLFDMPASYMLFYAVLAWVSFLAQETPIAPSARPSAPLKRREPHRRLSAKQQALLGLVTIGMLFSIYSFNVRAFAQVRAGEEASASIGDPVRFSERAQDALSRRSWLTNDVAGILADVLAQSGKARDPAYSQAASQVTAQLENEIAARDLDPRTYFRLGALYNVVGDRDRSALPKAEAAWRAAIQIAPKWPENYIGMSQTYLLEGRNDEALALLKKAVDINPENGVALWMYACSLISTHHEQEGRAELEVATRYYNYWANPDDLKRLVNTYYQFKDLSKAIQFEKELVQLEPTVAAHRYTLATLYKASGNTAEALEEAKIAAQLDSRHRAAIRKFQMQ
jgi:tetratricopeptide (TPR) repeat protein